MQPPFTPIIHDISIHALLAESDPPIMSPSGMNSNFNPRSPCGERLSGLVVLVKVPGISIHALLAESDLGFCPWQPWSRPISIHALLAESDRNLAATLDGMQEISIHALLAESDNMQFSPSRGEGISIHALLAESDVSLCRIITHNRAISIHALLAESDPCPMVWSARMEYFNPRSPCGERRLLLLPPNLHTIFQSTLSLRRATVAPYEYVYSFRFQSTLSLRRATARPTQSDALYTHFNPRSPCGERPVTMESPQH